MKSKDLFQLAIRILGLAFIYQALHAANIVQVFGSLPQFEFMAGGGYRRTFTDFNGIVSGVIMIVWSLWIAVWLLRGAPWLMRVAYPETTAPAARDPSPGIVDPGA